MRWGAHLGANSLSYRADAKSEARAGQSGLRVDFDGKSGSWHRLAWARGAFAGGYAPRQYEVVLKVLS